MQNLQKLEKEAQAKLKSELDIDQKAAREMEEAYAEVARVCRLDRASLDSLQAINLHLAAALEEQPEVGIRLDAVALNLSRSLKEKYNVDGKEEVRKSRHSHCVWHAPLYPRWARARSSRGIFSADPAVVEQENITALLS